MLIYQRVTIWDPGAIFVESVQSSRINGRARNPKKLWWVPVSRGRVYRRSSFWPKSWWFRHELCTVLYSYVPYYFMIFHGYYIMLCVYIYILGISHFPTRTHTDGSWNLWKKMRRLGYEVWKFSNIQKTAESGYRTTIWDEPWWHPHRSRFLASRSVGLTGVLRCHELYKYMILYYIWCYVELCVLSDLLYFCCPWNQCCAPVLIGWICVFVENNYCAWGWSLHLEFFCLNGNHMMHVIF